MYMQHTTSLDEIHCVATQAARGTIFHCRFSGCEEIKWITIYRALVCMRCCKHIVFHWSFSLTTDAAPSSDSEEPIAEEGMSLVKHRRREVSVLDYRCRGTQLSQALIWHRGIAHRTVTRVLTVPVFAPSTPWINKKRTDLGSEFSNF